MVQCWNISFADAFFQWLLFTVRKSSGHKTLVGGLATKKCLKKRNLSFSNWEFVLDMQVKVSTLMLIKKKATFWTNHVHLTIKCDLVVVKCYISWQTVFRLMVRRSMFWPECCHCSIDQTSGYAGQIYWNVFWLTHLSLKLFPIVSFKNNVLVKKI